MRLLFLFYAQKRKKSAETPQLPPITVPLISEHYETKNDKGWIPMMNVITAIKNAIQLCIFI